MSSSEIDQIVYLRPSRYCESDSLGPTAVSEFAGLEGQEPTQRAPRQSLLGVATGRDAADTAFLTNFGPPTTLTGLEVTAVVDQFELDSPDLLTQLR